MSEYEKTKARARLLGQIARQVETFALLSPSSRREWERRRIELRSFGPQSVFHLVPVRSIIHSRISKILLEHDIHTKQDLSSIDPTTIREWGVHPRPDTIGGLPVSDLLLTMRELACLERN